MKTAIFLASGYEEIEAITVIDILRRAGIEVHIVSTAGAKTVKDAHGIKIESDIAFDFLNGDDYDALILPGGMPGTLNLKRHDGVKSMLSDYIEKKRLVAAICAAPIVLGELGLLSGKNATCYPGYEKHLKGAILQADEVVLDANILTSRGPATAMVFALKIVEILGGKKLAKTHRERLLLS